MEYCLAIDIGASSGRHIVGWREQGAIHTEEVYRFPNGMQEENGHLTWDTEALLCHVKKGIEEAVRRFGRIQSLSIDTWGVDYVLLKGDKIIPPAYAYRDTRNEKAAGQVHQVIPFSELYRKCGIQYLSFNTVYQLYADKEEGRLGQGDDYLMMPEYLMYRLCGNKAHEYTNATTGSLVNAGSGQIDREITEKLGFPEFVNAPLRKPGEKIGEYQGISVVLCATHDTASAVAGIPMEGDSLFLSSGTWSLIGAKIDTPLTDEQSQNSGYSNEGGVGCITYLKNIQGMWLVNELRREMCPGKDFSWIVQEAMQSDFEGTIQADSDAFMAPLSMKQAFDEALGVPMQEADYFRCAYLSLAKCYAQAVKNLEGQTGKKYERLYIVGGGAKNDFLNRLTEKETGLQVIALPIEATALGNLAVQFDSLEK